MSSREREFDFWRDTGRSVENAYLGRVVESRELDLAAERIVQEADLGAQRELLFELVKKFQPSSPTDPQTDVARDIRLAVAESLGLDEASMERLGFCTAVGSIIDRLFGVDAWVELKNDVTGQVYRATMDVTRDREKQAAGYKADEIVPQLPDVSDEAAYLEAIDRVGRRLAKVIRMEMDAGRAPASSKKSGPRRSIADLHDDVTRI